MTPKTPAQVLREAAEYIKEHGWCKRVHRAQDGRVCALGALDAVAGGVDNAVAEMLAYSIGATDDGCLSAAERIVKWNDRRKRTKSEVISALLAAADQAERQAT